MADLIAAEAGNSGAYRVLARKYRPKGFEDLIGQEAMVRTLRNAFRISRIHQAYIFTGVRGVGKTTTARIIARALNYETDDGSVKQPTIEMPVYGRHCESIIDSRHVDVIEMDAASNTGVDNVREIIESVRYRPAYARYKVYIIDEVHMLSNASFNALLKTLEEPPEHVKFLFATTEIRKVPITVLSRCQRFDLKRIDGALLINYLKGICAKENVSISDEALALIVRAGEGSARDSLSLLDQAIAHGAGTIEADQVRDMLGLADRARVIDLFEMVMRGDIKAALNELKSQYDSGAEPVSIITDVAEYVHTVTRLKIAPGAADDPTLSETERKRGQTFANEISIRALTRAWQILTKGLPEVQTAPRPIVAAEMLVVRLAYAADLPTPDEALKMLKSGAGFAPSAAPSSPPRGGGGGAAAQAMAAPSLARPMLASSAEPARAAQAAPSMRIESFPALVALAREKRDPLLVNDLERMVRLVRFDDGLMEFALSEDGDPSLPQRLARKLLDWTGRRWAIALSQGDAQPTLREVTDAKKLEEENIRKAHPVVQALMRSFPGAVVIPAVAKVDAATPAVADLAAQPVVNEDGDVVVAEGDYSDDDL